MRYLIVIAILSASSTLASASDVGQPLPRPRAEAPYYYRAPAPAPAPTVNWSYPVVQFSGQAWPPQFVFGFAPFDVFTGAPILQVQGISIPPIQ